MTRSFTKKSIFLAILLTGALVAGYSARPSSKARPNVLVIVVDTLGAKHISPYSPALSHTPAIEKLADSGVLFQNAFAAAPWTKPSIASILTALSPAEHGVTKMRSKVPHQIPTLAETFKQNGYATGAVVSHSFLNAGLGFDQGFDSYTQVNVKNIHSSITSKKASDKAIGWLEDLKRTGTGAPFFLFVHYFDPHYVYRHHAERGGRSGKTGAQSDYSGALKPGMPLRQLREMRASFSREDLRFLESLYHEEIAFTDSQIGRLLEHLESNGIADDTVIVLTADHGEEFMEHGWIGHTRNLYNDVIRVPMIVRYPKVTKPQVSDYAVSHLDIGPTVLDFAGIEGKGGEGASLRQLLSGESAPAERTLFSEVEYQGLSGETDADMIAAIRRPFKLIKDRSSGRYELYDISADPAEMTDLMPSRPEVAEPLRVAIEQRAAGGAFSAPEEQEHAPSKKELEQLKTLGYL